MTAPARERTAAGLRASSAVLLIRDGVPVVTQLDAAAARLVARRHRLVLVTGAPATALAAVRDGQVQVVLMLRLGDGRAEDRFAQLVTAAGGRVEFAVRSSGGQVLQVTAGPLRRETENDR